MLCVCVVCVFLRYTERTLLTTVLYLLGLVPLVLLLTPFMPRLTLHRLFFTYCIPVVPAVLLFDGIVSCLRTYTKVCWLLACVAFLQHL